LCHHFGRGTAEKGKSVVNQSGPRKTKGRVHPLETVKTNSSGSWPLAKNFLDNLSLLAESVSELK